MPEVTFLDFTTGLDALLVDGVGAAVQSALGWVATPMRAALMLYVIIHAFNMIAGEGSGRSLIMACIRATIIAAMVQAAHFVPWVQDAVLTEIPNGLAGAMNGKVITAGAAQQFDLLASALKHSANTIISAIPGFMQMADRAVIRILNLVGYLGIVVMWLVWYVPRILVAIILPLGPILIPLFIFRATRGFAESWVGKLVSLLLLQASGSVLVVLLINRIQAGGITLDENTGALMGAGAVGNMIDHFMGQAGLMWFGAFIMIVLPVAITFGSGVGAGVSMIIAAAGTPVRMAAGRIR